MKKLFREWPPHFSDDPEEQAFALKTLHTMFSTGGDWGPIRSMIFGRRRCWCGKKHAAARFYRFKSNMPGYWTKPTQEHVDAIYLEAMLGPKDDV